MDKATTINDIIGDIGNYSQFIEQDLQGGEFANAKIYIELYKIRIGWLYRLGYDIKEFDNELNKFEKMYQFKFSKRFEYLKTREFKNDKPGDIN